MIFVCGSSVFSEVRIAQLYIGVRLIVHGRGLSTVCRRCGILSWFSFRRYLLCPYFNVVLRADPRCGR